MNSTGYPTTPVPSTDATPAGDAAKNAIDAANDAADRAVYALSDQVDTVRNEVAPKLKDGIDQAQTMVDQSMVYLRDAADNLRRQADDLADDVVTYTRNEPVKALLIAAAVGAALMGLLSLMGRSDD